MKPEIENEYSGGTIIQSGCPKCGRFVNIPKFYRPRFSDGKAWERSFIGSFAISKCKNCKIKVELHVEYI